MRYFFISQTYWPFFFYGVSTSHPVWGMLLGAGFALCALFLAWRVEFGDWTPWKS